MTILVGYEPSKGGRAALELAMLLGRSGRPDDIAVATVIPEAWPTPSLARVDAEYRAWAKEQGDSALRRAEQYLTEHAPDLTVSTHRLEGRSVSAALSRSCLATQARVLVLGSAPDGPLGRVVIGSTTEPLLHSADRPLAIAPRGYRAGRDARISRISCAFPGTPDAEDLLIAANRWREELGGRLRVLTFGVRGRTMYPPEVGLRAEDAVLDQWREQVGATQQQVLADLRGRGLLADDVTAEVVTGQSWADALDEVEWGPGEVLVVGSNATGRLARVFLGSRALRIVRQAPVPVLVVPAAVAAEAAADGEAG